MSETELLKGTLVPVQINGKSLEEQAKNLLENKKRIQDTYLDELIYEYSKKYYVDRKRNIIYKVMLEELEESDINIVEKTKEGYRFLLGYYNGGTSFNNEVTEGLKKLNENE